MSALGVEEGVSVFENQFPNGFPKCIGKHGLFRFVKETSIKANFDYQKKLRIFAFYYY